MPKGIKILSSVIHAHAFKNQQDSWNFVQALKNKNNAGLQKQDVYLYVFINTEKNINIIKKDDYYKKLFLLIWLLFFIFIII